nr:MAG TPA: hypothetical protein [Caudoviricetes sp.]
MDLIILFLQLVPFLPPLYYFTFISVLYTFQFQILYT